MIPQTLLPRRGGEYSLFPPRRTTAAFVMESLRSDLRWTVKGEMEPAWWMWEWVWEGCSRHKRQHQRGLAGSPFLALVGRFYCLALLKVSSTPRAAQKASISWERCCQTIRDELCDQQQKRSWQAQREGNLNIQESKNSGLRVKWWRRLSPLGYTVVACSEFVTACVKFKPLFSCQGRHVSSNFRLSRLPWSHSLRRLLKRLYCYKHKVCRYCYKDESSVALQLWCRSYRTWREVPASEWLHADTEQWLPLSAGL